MLHDPGNLTESPRQIDLKCPSKSQEGNGFGPLPSIFDESVVPFGLARPISVSGQWLTFPNRIDPEENTCPN